MSYILGSRHTIVWKFHYKRNCLATEQSSPKKKGHKDSHDDTTEIQGDHHNRTIFWEKCCCKKRINRKFCRTAHERCQQYCHFTVTFRRKCTAGHNSRNRTSKSYQHRNNTSSGKPDLTKKFVHNKSYPCHISTVFQK